MAFDCDFFAGEHDSPGRVGNLAGTARDGLSDSDGGITDGVTSVDYYFLDFAETVL